MKINVFLSNLTKWVSATGKKISETIVKHFLKKSRITSALDGLEGNIKGKTTGIFVPVEM